MSSDSSNGNHHGPYPGFPVTAAGLAENSTNAAGDGPECQNPFRVLLVNWSLKNRGGTESVIRDIALGLHARDLAPLVYAPSLGPIAEEIAAAGIPVVDDLARIGDQPDIIHAQHFFTAGEALIHFPLGKSFCTTTPTTTPSPHAVTPVILTTPMATASSSTR
ncbi:MAG TPA: hypothetical protein VHA37_03090 [Candidatus Saccharimonadales bacterium]|nr:hypothetical protein [Candidatus Saccharimonadales bacterium]